jgi:hypothetical protein
VITMDMIGKIRRMKMRDQLSDEVDLSNVVAVTSKIDHNYSDPDDLKITTKLKLV